MKGKSRIILIVILAYVLGFTIGCLVLGSGTTKDVMGKIFGRHGTAAGVKISEKGIKSVLPAGTREGQIRVIRFNYDVIAGAEEELALSTQPGQTCTLRYTSPIGVDEEIDAQPFQTAGQDGICHWVWNISKDTPEGVGTVVVSVGSNTSNYFFNIKH